MRSHHLIIGNGEIGKAIYKCYSLIKKPYVFDKKDKKRFKRTSFELLHICFPFFNKTKFIEQVVDYVREYNPKIVIIHSTVEVGTTREIYKMINPGKKNKIIVAHSLCRGKHPDLFNSIKHKFVKPFGILPNSFKSIDEVMSKMRPLFNKVAVFNTPETSEFGKLYSTTQYLHQIAIATAIYEDSKEYKGRVNFDQAYTFLNQSYNKAYSNMGMSQFVRPILKPCKDVCGGHCLRENLEILRKGNKKCRLLTPPIDKKKYEIK